MGTEIEGDRTRTVQKTETLSEQDKIKPGMINSIVKQTLSHLEKEYLISQTDYDKKLDKLNTYTIKSLPYADPYIETEKRWVVHNDVYDNNSRVIPVQSSRNEEVLLNYILQHIKTQESNINRLESKINKILNILGDVFDDPQNTNNK